MSKAIELKRLKGRTIARASIDVGKTELVIEFAGGGRLIAQTAPKGAGEEPNKIFSLNITYV